MAQPDPHPAEISSSDAPLENMVAPTPSVGAAQGGSSTAKPEGADRTPASPPQRQPPREQQQAPSATRPDRTGPPPSVRGDAAALAPAHDPASATPPARDAGTGGQLDEPQEGEGRQMH